MIKQKEVKKIMINIGKQDYIGKGQKRACYKHPENKKLCIKIMYSNQHYSELCKEIVYYNKIQEEHKKYSLNFYAKYHGTVETNLGTGYVYDLFRDDDGSVSLTLEHYFKINNIFSIEDLRNACLKLKLNMAKYPILWGDMNLGNILVHMENNTINLVIVDGLGEGNIKEMPEPYKQFIKTNFMYLCSDIAIKHVSLDFIYGRSKTMIPLQAISSFCLSTIDRNTLGCNNKEIFYCFKKSIRNNIDIITYDFERVHLLLLVYYFRYKLKKIANSLK